MMLFVLLPGPLVGLFIGQEGNAARIAIDGLPLFALGYIFYVTNVASIGLLQSLEKMKPAMLFACLRGLVFIVPSFIIMPRLLGDAGIWLAMAVSEALTTAAIALYYFIGRRRNL